MTENPSHEPTPSEQGGPENPSGAMPSYGSQAYGGVSPQQPYPAGTMTPSDENTWSAMAHFGGILLGFLAPLIVMLAKGNDSPRVRAQAVEALNFQISVMIYAFASVVLMIVLIGFLTIFAVGIGALVFSILAGVKAINGEAYNYPLTIRLVK